MRLKGPLKQEDCFSETNYCCEIKKPEGGKSNVLMFPTQAPSCTSTNLEKIETNLTEENNIFG